MQPDCETHGPAVKRVEIFFFLYNYDGFGLRRVKEPRHSDSIFAKKCYEYLYRSRRLPLPLASLCCVVFGGGGAAGVVFFAVLSLMVSCCYCCAATAAGVFFFVVFGAAGFAVGVDVVLVFMSCRCW